MTRTPETVRAIKARVRALVGAVRTRERLFMQLSARKVSDGERIMKAYDEAAEACELAEEALSDLLNGEVAIGLRASLAVSSLPTEAVIEGLPRWGKVGDSDWYLYASRADVYDCFVCNCSGWVTSHRAESPRLSRNAHVTLAEVYEALEAITGIPAEQLAALPGAPKETT